MFNGCDLLSEEMDDPKKIFYFEENQNFVDEAKYLSDHTRLSTEN